jgi:hypothetical protein
LGKNRWRHVREAALELLLVSQLLQPGSVCVVGDGKLDGAHLSLSLSALCATRTIPLPLPGLQVNTVKQKK